MVVQERSVVWVSLGGRLYRVAPEHLRTCTEREGIVFDLNYPNMGNDIEKMLLRGQFEDLVKAPKPTAQDLRRRETVVLDPRDIPPEAIGDRFDDKRGAPEAGSDPSAGPSVPVPDT